LLEQKMFYLICYDVVNDRRRDRVSRLFEAYGLRIQKSVFECVLTPDQYASLQKRLQTKRYLNPEEDQIRFYPIAPRHRKLVLILGAQPQRQVDDAVFIV
jgi:CRISPR-associated protein Cas2